MEYRVYYCSDEFEETQIKPEDFKNHKGYSYSNCPVWNHRLNRTNIGYSPCKFSISITDNVIQYRIDDSDVNEIDLSQFDMDDYYSDDYIEFSVSDIYKENPVIQLLFPTVYVWTDFETDYMWFEFLDHPLTSINNNYIAIGGWFNVANHPRTSSLAIQFCKKDVEVKFEKNEPLYRMRFYTKDMNDNISLIKKLSHQINFEGEMDSMKDRRKILHNDPKLMKNVLFDKDLRKKCPHHYNKFENV